MLKIDVIVFWLCVACGIFWLGIELGIAETKKKIATTCIEIPGQRLTSTIQNRQGVLTCIYGRKST